MLSFTTTPLVIAVILLQFAVLYMLDRQGILKRIPVRKIAFALAVYLTMFGVAWAALADVWPEWDSSAIFDAASEFGVVGSRFYEPGRYVERFPHQLAYILLVHAVEVTVGHRYAVMECINALAAGLLGYAIVMLTSALFTSRRVANIAAFLLFGFFPLVFYSTFAYPNMISLAFAAWAMLFQAKALMRLREDEGRNGKMAPASCVRQAFTMQSRMYVIRYIAGSALCAAASYLFKSSMLLVLVAMVVVWIGYGLRNWRCLARSFVSLGALVALMVCCVAGVSTINGYAELRTGIDTSRAMPSSAYIAMGFNHDSKGWYTGFLWSLDEGDETTYDPARYDEVARQLIAEETSRMVEQPLDALVFFATKYCSEWCDPTSESLLASNWSISPSDLVMSERVMSPLLKSIYYGPVHQAIVFFLDGWQSLVLISALVAVLRGWRALNRADEGIAFTIDRLAPMLYVAGLALFYVVWEAKAQYTMPGYVMLVPYAAVGIAYITKRIDTALLHRGLCRTHSRG